jgi:hypothetical protein
MAAKVLPTMVLCDVMELGHHTSAIFLVMSGNVSLLCSSSYFWLDLRVSRKELDLFSVVVV